MYNFSVFIEKEGDFYVAHNLELGIVSQGENYNEALSNLKEATELYLEDENKETLFAKIKGKNYSLTTMKI